MISLELLQCKVINDVILCLIPLTALRFEELRLCGVMKDQDLAFHCSLVITVVQRLWGMSNCCILLRTCNWNNNRIKGSFIVKRLWSCIMWFHIFSLKTSAFQTSLWLFSVPLTLQYYTGVYFTWQIPWNVDYVIRKKIKNSQVGLALLVVIMKLSLS